MCYKRVLWICRNAEFLHVPPNYIFFRRDAILEIKSEKERVIGGWRKLCNEAKKKVKLSL
jgi:hypothetical protein